MDNLDQQSLELESFQKPAQPQLDNDIFQVLENLTKVQNEKTKRCQSFKQQENIPIQYIQNTPKEELVLEHVIQFKRQFQYQLYFEDKRELFLYPKNECDVYKFICTTVRPTKLGFLELYDYQQCSKYLSQYIQYEELDPPNEFPQIIPSPTNVAEWQKGDCFDLSILLCSLLIGVGYNAYCVYGKAPREITTKNESQMEYLFLDKGKYVEFDDKRPKENTQNNEFNIKKKIPIVSAWEKKKEQERLDEIAEKKRIAMTIDDDEADELIEDPYQGERLHCWVLIRPGKRQIEKNIFIEPSTGRLYSPENSPFESIDCVFNNMNFWINMKPECEVKNLNFDEMDTSLNWEYVMLDTLQFQGSTSNEEEGNPDIILDEQKDKQKNPEQDQLQDIAQLLDMAPPWPPKIYIDKEKFIKGSPLGEGTFFFNRVKVDNYSPYSQINDGLVQKISIYEDFKRLKVKEYRYFYKHRSDKLSIRRRFPFEFKTIEDYEPAKYENKQIPQAMQQWKQVIQIDRHMKVIKYYPNRNHDGLIERFELIGQKTILYYQNRDDKVIYRSIRFDPKRTSGNQNSDKTFQDNHVGDVIITKMTQKFEKNPNYPANDQIQRMVIDLIKDKVIIQYHMNEGEITPIIKIYSRDTMHGFAKLNEPGGDNKIDDPLVQLENTKIVNLEKECLNQLKQQEKIAKDDEGQMREEKVKLEYTLHDKARIRFNNSFKKNEEDMAKDAAVNDYLYPFLEKRKLLGEREIPYQQAIEIKNEFMSKLKERFLSRAEIIQRRLEEQRQILDQKNQQISKKPELDQKLAEEIKEVNFKIDILEQRALRFESMALQKYQEMDNKLNNDGRLAAIHRK
ncbi:hypothetical protein IMG5_061790 [Ichthyophthirius multifiliis]|uniref:Dynein regulatory complex subunit 7 n=1 Tax=Ichthyophthirius multifiliis TaxID=5932 RepID=G0QNW0_ICHMU|nr:hypothetical protein IMG5_061790 [Ichthyophthirius multifiliis]EGR33096.1 hypothetical protein IMG5_061790 [Ichthyophthirius multifiliis]|eukprot:XP_004037082.1 hypothetical protein IMG5_061790 [Ichthyophthirius multifiliis]